MHKVAIYRRYAYQSPNHRPRWSFVLTILMNKHEIVFHNLNQFHWQPQTHCKCTHPHFNAFSLFIQ